jgi:nucleoside 2-deoxyribosyltransferase
MSCPKEEKMKVYLAGPEVFFVNGEALIQRKRVLTIQYGFQPNIWMGDTEIPNDKFGSGLYISAANEVVMRDADFIIANITPFRGPTADVGTSFELGFMCAMDRPAFAYSNDPRHYEERITGHFDGTLAIREDGVFRADDGQMVEYHDMADNLMLDGGIAARGGIVARPKSGPVLSADDLSMFEECLAAARRFFDGKSE